MARTAAVTVVPLLPPQPTSMTPNLGTARSVRKVKRVARGVTCGSKLRGGGGEGRCKNAKLESYSRYTNEKGEGMMMHQEWMMITEVDMNLRGRADLLKLA